MRSLLILIAGSLLAGCSVTASPWFTADGSRSDATVVVACNYDLFEVCEALTSEELEGVVAACNGWGYTEGARPFDSVTTIPTDEFSGCVFRAM